MPNIKSSVLSVKKDAKRHARNVARKKSIKAAIRQLNNAIASGDAAAAQTLLSAATKEIDKAACRNVIHKNNAARKKSALAKKVNALA